MLEVAYLRTQFKMQFVLSAVLIALAVLSGTSAYTASTDLTYQLYTQAAINTPIDLLVSTTSFNKNLLTRIIIHDNGDNKNSPINAAIKNAYLNKGLFNVIVVDWSAGGSTTSSVVIGRVKETGDAIAQFIQNLATSTLADISTMSIIGHGYGAHVAGFAGRALDVLAGKKLQSIVSLDPISQGYSDLEPAKRLRNTDALYVETIHTSVTTLFTQLGTSLFYPTLYPTGPLACGINAKCIRDESWKLFVGSISLPRPGRKCNILGIVNALTCLGTVANMGGEPLDTTANGPYLLSP